MQTKPTAPGDGGKRAQDLRDLSVARFAGLKSSETDVQRAEWEGMGPANSAAPRSADAERHLARQRSLTGRVMAFDLTAESDQLGFAPESPNAARTLAKLDSIRLTLMKLGSGKTIPVHQAAHQVSIHALSGRVVLHIEGVPVDLPTGHVVVLARGVAHDIVAKENSTLLITVSAPERTS